MASTVEELQKDLEVKVILEKATRKRVRDALTAERFKIETEIKNKMQQKSQEKKTEPLDDEKPATLAAPITTGCTVKIRHYGWDQAGPISTAPALRALSSHVSSLPLQPRELWLPVVACAQYPILTYPGPVDGLILG
ncbi:Calcyclin-binding protein [Tupaia chinensis]|uniref:Calcyclin-binding protein n=1 Tax=Tupaia chinensis TaxID=246437 RepID=L9JK83_TUPCH|nr:Calcyclin-binding protein [Tupaia chinensis]